MEQPVLFLLRLTCTPRHGTQGVLDTASHGTLDDEFGTHKEEDVVMQILEKGDVQETEVGHAPCKQSTEYLT